MPFHPAEKSALVSPARDQVVNIPPPTGKPGPPPVDRLLVIVIRHGRRIPCRSTPRSGRAPGWFPRADSRGAPRCEKRFQTHFPGVAEGNSWYCGLAQVSPPELASRLTPRGHVAIVVRSPKSARNEIDRTSGRKTLRVGIVKHREHETTSFRPLRIPRQTCIRRKSQHPCL